MYHSRGMIPKVFRVALPGSSIIGSWRGKESEQPGHGVPIFRPPESLWRLPPSNGVDGSGQRFEKSVDDGGQLHIIENV
jgi:hypothetical protein